MNKTGKLKKIKRGLLLALCCTLALLLLVGCGGGNFTDEEKKAVEEQGRSGVKAFLAENLPDAELLSCQAYLIFIPGRAHPEFLTEYVTGEYEDADGVWQYYFNSETGQMFADRYYEEIEREREAWANRTLLDMLGLSGEELQDRLIWVYATYLPHSERKENKELSTLDWCVRALPFGVTDATEYLEDVENREPIRIGVCEIAVPEETDFSGYNYDFVFHTRNGIALEKVQIRSGNAEFTAVRGQSASYIAWSEAELADCILGYTGLHRLEEPDEAGHGVVVRETGIAPQDIRMEQTAEGYAIRFPGTEDKDLRIRLYARDANTQEGNTQEGNAQTGMKILENEYALRYPDKDTSVDLVWVQEEDGRFALCNDTRVMEVETWRGDVELIRR